MTTILKFDPNDMSFDIEEWKFFFNHLRFAKNTSKADKTIYKGKIDGMVVFGKNGDIYFAKKNGLDL